MAFISSKVYSDLYLIKNVISDKEALNKVLKKMVTKKINSQFMANQKKSIPELNYSIRFYEYYKAWGFIPFGEAGTTHFFKKNEEDPGGFSSELLQHYPKYKLQNSL